MLILMSNMSVDTHSTDNECSLTMAAFDIIKTMYFIQALTTVGAEMLAKHYNYI